MNDEEYALKLKQRYQFQPWYVKLWRRRHYTIVPYIAIKSWFKSNGKHGFRFETVWSIAIGLAQSKMEWYYTMDEVKERWDIKRAGLKAKIDEKNK